MAPAIETALPDVRALPLGDVPSIGFAAFDSALERLVPVPRAVPVAAFTSGI